MMQKMRVYSAALAVFVLMSVTLTFAQQTEGRRRKTEAAPSKTAIATDAANAGNDNSKDQDTEKDKDQKSEGDPLFKGMKYRSIGPFRGGRSLTAAGIPGDPTTYYFGSTGGGVWKSIDGANTWSPIFDKDGAPSIGSIAVALSDPEAAQSFPRLLRALVTTSAQGTAVTSRPAQLDQFAEGGPEARLIAAMVSHQARLLVASTSQQGRRPSASS